MFFFRLFSHCGALFSEFFSDPGGNLHHVLLIGINGCGFLETDPQERRINRERSLYYVERTENARNKVERLEHSCAGGDRVFLLGTVADHRRNPARELADLSEPGKNNGTVSELGRKMTASKNYCE